MAASPKVALPTLSGLSPGHPFANRKPCLKLPEHACPGAVHPLRLHSLRLLDHELPRAVGADGAGSVLAMIFPSSDAKAPNASLSVEAIPFRVRERLLRAAPRRRCGYSLRPASWRHKCGDEATFREPYARAMQCFPVHEQLTRKPKRVPNQTRQLTKQGRVPNEGPEGERR